MADGIVALAPAAPRPWLMRQAARDLLTFYPPATVIAAVMLFPLLWTQLLSLRTNAQISSFPPRLVDPHLRWHHFTDIWTDPRMNIGIQAWNTLVHTTMRTFLQVPLSAMAAFVLARHRFLGRDLIFWLILATGMIAHEVMLVPLDLLVRSVPVVGGIDLRSSDSTGWLDTKAGLILPGILSGHSMFFLR